MSHPCAHKVRTAKYDVFTRFLDLLIDTLMVCQSLRDDRAI